MNSNHLSSLEIVILLGSTHGKLICLWKVRYFLAETGLPLQEFFPALPEFAPAGSIETIVPMSDSPRGRGQNKGKQHTHIYAAIEFL